MSIENLSKVITELSKPFPATDIHWRVGATTGDKKKGIALGYLDARDVMLRLDAVCGTDWQNRYPLASGSLLICEIGLKLGDEWVWRSNGAGETQVEAEKGSASDAFKRAAVMWGVGRYLYDLPNVWVPLTPAGKSYKFSDEVKGDLMQRLHKWQEKKFK